MEDVKIWLSETDKRSGRPSSDKSQSQETSLGGEMEVREHTGKEPQSSLNPQNDVNDDVLPSDSVSNQGSRSSSRVSSTSSARLRAEAEMAALLARQHMLKEKHSLKEQEEQLSRKKEQLQLEADIAATVAKVNVLRTGSTMRSVASRKSNGMESYFKTKGNSLEIPNADVETLVPQTLTKGKAITGNAELQVKTVQQNMKRERPAPSLVGPSDAFGSIPPLPKPQAAANENLSSLPKREIQTFDGDPLHFQAFMRSFEQVIEAKTGDAGDCLHYLAQYTKGQPNELVKSCQHMSESAGYVKAKTLLYEHFGNGHVIASAYLNKVHSWPLIRSEDGKALQAYCLFLRGCCNAMEEINDLSELNTPANMLAVIRRLPYKLKDKWRTVACDIQERQHRRAAFIDIVSFLERQVKIATDPVFGNLCDVPAIHLAAKGSNGGKRSPHLRAKGSSFATTVSDVERQNQTGAQDRHSTVKACFSCKGGHTLESCALLDKKPHNEKISFLKKNSICFGCLCTGHISKECRKRLSCKICGLRHASILHIHHKEKNEVKPNNEADNIPVTIQTSGLTGAGEQDCKLAIVPVKVKSKRGQRIVETYAFLDQGSSASFCTVGLIDKLNIAGRRTKILLRTMGQEKMVDSFIVPELEVAGLDSDMYCDMPNLFTQHKMPVDLGNIPNQQDLDDWPHLKHVHLPEIKANVELLIGMNMPRALEPLEVIRSVGDGPFAIRTVLGWTVNGPLNRECCGRPGCLATVTANRVSAVTLDKLWKQQFKMDFPESSDGEQMGLSKEDLKFLELASKTVTLRDGHNSIALPLRDRDIRMPDNRAIAEQRALGLKKRFIRDKDFHKDYTAFVTDLISRGYAKRVPVAELEHSDGKLWYIPHHGVYHPTKGKMRGVSLNAQLLSGPDLTNGLVGVLTRFRKEPIVLMSDIEAMFHQVHVPEEDADRLRFLWCPGGDFNQSMQEYRMGVHLFGATSSPSCANYALRKCAEDNKAYFSQQVTDTILYSFYVDDCLASICSEEEAINLYSGLRDICAKGGFHLTKWISNSCSVLAVIPEEERANEVKDLDLDCDLLPVELALGVRWCLQSDAFKFCISIPNRPLTRRGILSTVSSFYDPLGFLAPVIFTAKRILQDLCQRGIGWDDAIPSAVAEEWKSWVEELHLLNNISIGRCLKPPDFGETTTAQLHHFADASEKGYGAVTYLLLHNSRSQTHSSFIMGKSRVAPLKPVTIPRMELTAAVVAVRMDRMWRRELRLPLLNSVFWTDSTAVLKYINNETSRFRVFVANRVSEILKASSASQWRYVNTTHNPADLASRGMKAETFLRDTEWISGPAFLIQPENNWPVNPENLQEPSHEDPEVKASAAINVSQVHDDDHPLTLLIHRASSWTRLIRVMGWILRFKTLLLHHRKIHFQSAPDTIQSEDAQHKVEFWHGFLSLGEIEDAEIQIIKFCQRKSYAEEISCLQRGESVKRSSHIYKLNPVLEDDVLRVGGRLSRAVMSEDSKHPVIIAKELHISNLILQHIHKEVGHGGRNHILSKLHQKYWIPGAGTLIRSIMSRCVTCRRFHGAAGQQQMAELPESRVTPEKPPFSFVGVDYFGPFEVKHGRSLVKRYGVIFNCLAIRAVHIEVASSLDTDSFINALRRFIARRGQVQELRSDNGTNFVGAERELRRAMEEWNQEKISDALSLKGVKWIFNPPTGSHHGGAWERLIRSVRKVLNSTLQTQHLDEEGLQTALCEVESILNSRPITLESTDPNDLEALTPNHLLLLKSNPSLPPGLFRRDDLYARKRWRQVQYISDLFWKRWTKEYLPQLQQRQKWGRIKRNFVPGDVVLIVDDSAPRGSWIIGRVTGAVPDEKGLVRQVWIKTPTSHVCRPVTKICLLHETSDP
ncbi:Rab5 GDP/GTP exchange factor [Sarotherodon galilaeus]